LLVNTDKVTPSWDTRRIGLVIDALGWFQKLTSQIKKTNVCRRREYWSWETSPTYINCTC
jgi:hypothetical protein